MALLMRVRLRSLILAVLFTSMFIANYAQATVPDRTRQYKLEAAFLYNFLNYITWPGLSTPDEMTSATICILQGDPIDPYLTYVQQKMGDQRQIAIKHLAPESNAEGCQIFFSRRGIAPHSATTTPILTVSTDATTSMIRMRAEEDGMALRINNTMLSEQGFGVSSRLLSLAQEVK